MGMCRIDEFKDHYLVKLNMINCELTSASFFNRESCSKFIYLRKDIFTFPCSVGSNITNLYNLIHVSITFNAAILLWIYGSTFRPSFTYSLTHSFTYSLTHSLSISVSLSFSLSLFFSSSFSSLPFFYIFY